MSIVSSISSQDELGLGYAAEPVTASREFAVTSSAYGFEINEKRVSAAIAALEANIQNNDYALGQSTDSHAQNIFSDEFSELVTAGDTTGNIMGTAATSGILSSPNTDELNIDELNVDELTGLTQDSSRLTQDSSDTITPVIK